MGAPSPKHFSPELMLNSATNSMEPASVSQHMLCNNQKVQPLWASNSIHAISTHQILHAPTKFSKTCKKEPHTPPPEFLPASC
jgi:hypothetical protein